MNNAIDAIRPAVNATSQLIFPFSWRKWFYLALLVFFVGQGGLSFPNFNVMNADAFENGVFSWQSLDGLWSFIIAAIAVFLIISIAFYYVKSIFNFVLLDTVTKSTIAIRKSFNEYHEQGMSWFWYGIVLSLIALVLAGVPIIGGIYSFIQESYTSGVLLIILGIIVASAIGLFNWFVHDIVLPVMYFRKLRIIEAFHLAKSRMHGQWGQFALYCLLSVAISMGTVVVMIVAMLLLALAALIIGGILFGIGFVLYLLAPVLLIPLIVIGVFVAILLFTALFIGMLFVSVPFGVFFASYSLGFSKRIVLGKLR